MKVARCGADHMWPMPPAWPLVATVIIGAMYVCVVAGFDVVDRHRLVGQIDTRLQQRLAQAARQPSRRRHHRRL